MKLKDLLKKLQSIDDCENYEVYAEEYEVTDIEINHVLQRIEIGGYFS